MMTLPYTVRPLGPWVEPVTTHRKTSPFKTNQADANGFTRPKEVSWANTLDLLDREIHMLGARSWVLQVGGRGEQYRGWAAIGARPAEMTQEQAAEFIAHWAAGEMTGLTGKTLLANPAMLTSAYRAAAKATHPDRTGGDDGDTMARLNTARDLILKGANDATR